LPDDPVELFRIDPVFLAEIEAFGSPFPPGSIMRRLGNAGQ
jgi:hypothetical protein